MDNWKEKIIDSLEGMERAKPSAVAFDKIQSRIAQGEAETSKTSSGNWLSVAAVILIVICSNAFFVSNYYYTNNLSDEIATYNELITDFNIYEQ